MRLFLSVVFVGLFNFAGATEWEIVYVPSDIDASHRITVLARTNSRVTFATERFLGQTGERHFAIIEIDCTQNSYSYKGEGPTYLAARAQYEQGGLFDYTYDICCHSVNFYQKRAVCR